MNKFKIIIISLIIGFSSLHAVAFTKNIKYKTYNIIMSSNKPITVGNNTIDFNITNNHNKIDLNKVTVKVFMPAMPGMPAMQSISVSKPIHNNNYRNKINFSMSGTWQIHIFLTPKKGRKLRIKTSINI
jgi:hypothetical protein